MFHDNLKAARLRAGYSRKDMADMLGVSTNTYRLYESNVEPRIGGIVKLAQILHVSIDFLLDNVPDEYERCRDVLTGSHIEFTDLDDGRIEVTANYLEIKKTLIMTKDDFIDLVHAAERRDLKEIQNRFCNIFTDSYAYAVNRKFINQIDAEPLEYIDTP